MEVWQGKERKGRFRGIIRKWVNLSEGVWGFFLFFCGNLESGGVFYFDVGSCNPPLVKSNEKGGVAYISCTESIVRVSSKLAPLILLFFKSSLPYTPTFQKNVLRRGL